MSLVGSETPWLRQLLMAFLHNFSYTFIGAFAMILLFYYFIFIILLYYFMSLYSDVTLKQFHV